MSKFILASTFLAMSAMANNVFAGNAYPTTGLFQEMAGTIGSGKVSIDLINTSGFRDHVRLGLSSGGEIMYGTNTRGAGDGSASITEVKAGIYYSIKNRQAGRVYLVGEYIMDSNDTSGIYAALRFKPNKNVRIDVGFYESIDNGGAAGSDTTTGIPLFFRLNLSL